MCVGVGLPHCELKGLCRGGGSRQTDVFSAGARVFQPACSAGAPCVFRRCSLPPAGEGVDALLTAQRGSGLPAGGRGREQWGWYCGCDLEMASGYTGAQASASKATG